VAVGRGDDAKRRLATRGLPATVTSAFRCMAADSN
jgi:hypothetical protein